MSNFMPCGLEDDRIRFDSESAGLESFPPYYKSNKYRAAIEDCPHISLTGLTILWGNWSSLRPSMLANLLHGFVICSAVRWNTPEYNEIQFLIDLSTRIATEATNYESAPAH